jgi:hypothetical protein
LLWSSHEVFLLYPKSCVNLWSKSRDEGLDLEELTRGLLFIPSCRGMTGLIGGLGRSNQCKPFLGFASGERLGEFPVVGVLDRQTYQGSTRGSRLCGGDRGRETENSKVCARTRETRFVQVQVAKVANPTSCLEIKYGALRLVLVEIRCLARYPALLYIV